MKKFFAVFALFILFFAVSCDSGIKFENQNDHNSNAHKDDSDTETEDIDEEKTDTVPASDEDEKTDTVSESGDLDSGDTVPDSSDSQHDNAEPGNDNDSADSTDDDDTVDPDVTDTGETEGETRVQDCSDLPENAQWNTVSAIVQNWDGEKWVPSSKTSFNLEESETECHFKCNTNYGWNGSKCSADTKNVYCDAKPENTVWNDSGLGGTFTQTWNGTSWIPASRAAVYSKTPAECGFICAAGYLWDGSKCETAPTQVIECTGLPLVGAEWNTTSSITQSWDGEKWIPESTTGIYNETASTTECRFKCKEHYSWKNSQCVADTKTSPCMKLPTNGQWNTVVSIKQTWNGASWQPSTDGVYDTDSSTTECHFICKPNYKWISSTSKCEPETNIANCTGKPANAVWNGTGKFEQIWDGSGWYPETYESTYNKTAGICTYICDTNYTWSNGVCKIASTRTAACKTPLPENTEWNTVDTITQTYDGTDWYPSTTPVYNPEPSENECRYKCVSGYNWKNGSCVLGKSLSIGNICTGQVTCYDNSSLITCPSSGSFFGQDAYYASLGVYCTPQSFTLETISEETVVEDLNTGLMWQQTPSSTAYNWEYAKTYCKTSKYAGYEDWRLPTQIEFLSISDLGRTNPGFNSDYFSNISESDTPQLWTSQENKEEITKAYYITHNAVFDVAAKTTTYKVMCVRGNEIPKPSFTEKNINGYDVVLDSATDLMWQNEFPSKTLSEALSYCENSTYAGYNDWRLPNRNELASLLNIDKSEEPYSDFPNIPSSYFWSSNTTRTASYAWGLDFQSGNVSSTYKAQSLFGMVISENQSATICVRSNTDFLEAERTVNCVLKPELTVWNTASTITQTWNGSDWMPSPVGTLNSEPSASECRYKCIDGYHWEEWTEYYVPDMGGIATKERKECVSNTKTVSCTGLKTGAEWNTVSSITQTWNGEEWVPEVTSTEGVYNETASTTECHYKCKENYTWNREECEADTRTAECTGLPNNAEWWNDVLEFTQTWNGSSWQPTNQATFNETSSATECGFKCKSGYEWNQRLLKCEQLPHYDSSSGLTWSAKSQNGMSYSEAVSYCDDLTESGYSDWRLPTIDDLRTLLIADRVANNCQVSEANYCLEGSCWTCSSCSESCSNTNFAGLFVFCGSCSYYDDGRFSKFGDTIGFWSSSVRSDNSNYAWYVRFNDGYVNSSDGDLSGSNLDSSYNVRCVRGTNLNIRTVNCPEKPENTIWNDGTRNGTFTQIWNGEDWIPASYDSSYSHTAGICKYKCAPGYEWNGDSCAILDIMDENIYQCDSQSQIIENSTSPSDYAKAIGICQTTTEDSGVWGLISAKITAPSGNADNVHAGSNGLLSALGNIIKPKAGSYMLALTSSSLGNPIANTNYDGGTTSSAPQDWVTANGEGFPSAPSCGDGSSGTSGGVHDAVMLEMRIRTPENAKSFSFNIYFLTAEYPSYICSKFNDFFIALLDSSYTSSDTDLQNPLDQNLAMDALGNPVSVNLAPAGLFTQCVNVEDKGVTSCTGTEELQGTGFESNGGTGWLTTRGNVVGGEVITLRLAIWDLSDHLSDSLVLIDNFRWDVSEHKPGTGL